MNATGKALDWLARRRPRIARADRGDLLAEALAVVRRARTVSCSCRTSPASARRSGTPGARGVRRADPPPRPGAPRPGSARGRRPGPPSRRRADRRRRHPGPRAAGVRWARPRARALDRLKADVTGLHGGGPGDRRDGDGRLGDRRPGSGSARSPISPTGHPGDRPDRRPDRARSRPARGLRPALRDATSSSIRRSGRPSIGSPRSTGPTRARAPTMTPRARPARRRPARPSAELVAARGARGRSGPAGRAARRRHDRRCRDRRRRLHRAVDRVPDRRARPDARGSCSSSRRSAAAARAVATAAS